MSDNRFLEEQPAPGPEAIKAVLGDRLGWYEGVLAAAAGFRQDWKFHGRKYGWKLKVHDGEKVLYELTMAEGSFRLGIAARGAELEALRDEGSLPAGCEDILAAGKGSAGWGIRIAVDSEVAYGQAIALIKAVARIRQEGED